MTIENRLTALEETVVDNPITRIEFEELSESLDRLYSSLAEWSDEISKIETLEASQTGLQLSIENLENTVKSLREITPQQSDSEDIVSINDKIGEITTSLSAAENELQEMKSFIGLQSEEISTVRNELGDALDSLTARLNFVELSAKTSSESIGTNNELLAEITAEVDALSDYVSEQALSQMEKFSSLSEAFSDIEKRVIAAETSLSDFEEIKARLSASESATRILSDRISSLEAFYSSAEDIIPILEEKVGNLETSVFGTGKINMDELETEILQLREIADSLSRGFVKFNSELITLRESIPPEGVSIETFENSINELSDAIININADLSEIRSSVAELELSLGVLEDSLVGVSVGLDSMKGNFDGSVAAIDSNLKAIQKIENDLLLTQEDLAKTRDQLSTLTKELEKTLVTREEIITITEEAVKQSREATAQEISSLRRTNNIWLTVAVISSLAAIVLGVVNILP
jgi:chromosome segregation ATPase